MLDAPALDADVHPGEPYIMAGYSSTSAYSAREATGKPALEDSASVVHGRCVSRSAMPAEFMCLPEVGSDFMAMQSHMACLLQHRNIVNGQQRAHQRRHTLLTR
jgi:hypothetical protein